MTAYHEIRVGDGKPVVKIGAIRPIHLLVETRGGKKVVTRVLGLEAFGISPDEFADDLKPLCASSVAVYPATGEYKGMEVLAQGSHVRYVLQVLNQQGLDEQFVLLKDKTGKALAKAKNKA